MFVCDFCSKKFDSSFYRMDTNLKYCENSYKYVQERVNSENKNKIKLVFYRLKLRNPIIKQYYIQIDIVIK